MRRNQGRLLACACLLAILGSGCSKPPDAPVAPSPAPATSQDVPYEKCVNVYIAHGREIVATMAALQGEVNAARARSGKGTVTLDRKRAGTMNVAHARELAKSGKLKLFWPIPEDAGLGTGIVWTIPIVGPQQELPPSLDETIRTSQGAETPNARVAAALDAVGRRDPDAVRKASEALSAADIEQLRPLIAGPDIEKAMAAVRVVQGLGPRASGLVGAIASLALNLDSRNGKQGWDFTTAIHQCCEAIGNCGVSGADAVGELGKLAERTNNPSVRQDAIKAMVDIGARADAIEGRLIQLMESPDPGDRIWSVELASNLLDRQGAAIDRIRKALVAALRDSNDTVRREAAAALGSIGGDETILGPAIVRTVETIGPNPNKDDPPYAEDGFHDSERLSRGITGEKTWIRGKLLNLLRDPKPTVRARSAMVLRWAEITDEGTITALQDARKSEATDFVMEAIDKALAAAGK